MENHLAHCCVLVNSTNPAMSLLRPLMLKAGANHTAARGTDKKVVAEIDGVLPVFGKHGTASSTFFLRIGPQIRRLARLGTFGGALARRRQLLERGVGPHPADALAYRAPNRVIAAGSPTCIIRHARAQIGEAVYGTY
jgi:hypothetical protein